MAEWVRSFLDVALIVMVAAGLYQMARLIRHLAGLKQGRVEMERFVRDFHATVLRAEAGIAGLRQAARDRGDDLEKLIDRASLLRDELSFIVESADQLANRLTQNATQTKRTESSADRAHVEDRLEPKSAPAVVQGKTQDPATPSRAEKELLQALQKMK